jgi:hypothetical protein
LLAHRSDTTTTWKGTTMNSTTLRRQRSRTAAAVAATAAIFIAATACGTETVSDSGQPAAPAKVQAVHPPMSADTAERLGATGHRAEAQLQDGYLRHLLYVAQQRDKMKVRRVSEQTSGHHREISLG